jgi:hypothetical protein
MPVRRYEDVETQGRTPGRSLLGSLPDVSCVDKNDGVSRRIEWLVKLAAPSPMSRHRGAGRWAAMLDPEAMEGIDQV